MLASGLPGCDDFFGVLIGIDGHTPELSSHPDCRDACGRLAMTEGVTEVALNSILGTLSFSSFSHIGIDKQQFLCYYMY